MAALLSVHPFNFLRQEYRCLYRQKHLLVLMHLLFENANVRLVESLHDVDQMKNRFKLLGYVMQLSYKIMEFERGAFLRGMACDERADIGGCRKLGFLHAAQQFLMFIFRESDVQLNSTVSHKNFSFHIWGCRGHPCKKRPSAGMAESRLGFVATQSQCWLTYCTYAGRVFVPLLWSGNVMGVIRNRGS